MHLNWKRTKIFYGWWIVAASLVIALYAGGVTFYGFTAIFEPIANEFGWSYTKISLAASLRGLEMSLLAPITGRLVDRWGPRRLIFGGAIIICLGLILLSHTTSIGMFYGAFALIAMGLGTCTSTVLMTAVANWFHKRVGTVSGIVASGFGFGGLLVPIIVNLIDTHGWRIAINTLALGMLAVVVPLSLLFRHKPEQYGYLPDGEVKSTATPDNNLALPQPAEVDIGVKQAVKSKAFWHIAVATMCHMTMATSIVTHVMPYLSSIGIARSTSSLVATGIPLTSIIGRLGLGWLGDKFDRKQIAAAAFAMMGLGTFCFGYIASAGTWLLIPFFTFFCIGYGGSVALRPSLTRDFFGRLNFGSVFGLLMGLSMLGGLIGPPLAGWVYDNWGSYQNIWFVFAGLAVVGCILMLTIPSISATTQPSDKAQT